MSASIPEQRFNLPEDRVETLEIERVIRVGANAVHLTIEVPDDPISDSLHVIWPGFNGYEESMAGLRRAFAQQRLVTMSFNPARNPDSYLNSLRDAQALHVETQETIDKEVRDFSFRRQLPGKQQLDLDKKVLVPHSMGGLGAGRYTARNSLTVEKVVNVAALGYSRFSLGALLRHYPHIMNNSSQELAKAYHKQDLDLSPSDLLHAMKYCLKPQSIFEVISCFKDSVLKDVAHARAEGVRIAYIALGNDLVVRPNETVANYVDHYSVMEDAGHLAPATKPRLVAAQVINALQQLDIHQTPLSA